MTQALKKKKSQPAPKSDCQFQSWAGGTEEGVSPLCFPLGSKLVHRPELDFHISLQHVAPVRGPGKRQGQEPGWHLRKVWLCVCDVCTPGGWDPCEPGGKSAHIDGHCRVCVCARALRLWQEAEETV